MLNLRRFCVAALVVAGFCVSTATSRALDIRLLPANTEIVVTVNLKQILNSELVKSKDEAIKQIKAAIENAPNGDEVAKYLKIMGFDPFTDLISITLAHPGSQEQAEEIFVVIDGVFNAKKFAEAVKTASENYPGTITNVQIGGGTAYEISVQGKSVYVALVDGKSVVLAAQKDELAGAITRSKGNAVAAVKVKDLLKTLTDKQSFSVAITGEAIARLAAQAPGGGQLPPGAPDLADIRGLTAAVTITKEISFMLGVGFKNEKTAKDSENTATFALAALKLAMQQKAGQDPEFAPVVDVMRTLRISSNGSNLVLTGSVSQDNLEKLIKMIGGKFKQ